MATSEKRSSRADREKAVAALMRASKVFTAAVAHSLAVIDPQVSAPQLRVLVMIGSRSALNLSAVAEGLGVDRSNASRTCDRLVNLKLVARRDDENDRRNVVLTLTPDGQRLIDTVMEQRASSLTRMVERMRPADQRRLTSAMTALAEAASLEDHGFVDGDGQLFRWLI